jgi:hypothetical protein
MAEIFPIKSKKIYHKEFKKLYAKSNYYRSKYAKKALMMSRTNKFLELMAFTCSLIVAGIMTAVVSGFMSAGPAQTWAIILSCVVAFISAVVKPFFNPEEFIKLFYASGEFLSIREKVRKILRVCNALSLDELELEYHTLNKEYIELKKIYIEYIDSPASYYRHKRKLTAPGKRFTKLPPMSGKVNRSGKKKEDA